MKITIKLFVFVLITSSYFLACNNSQEETNSKTDTIETGKLIESGTLPQVIIEENQFTVNGKEKQFKGLCLQDIGPLMEIGHWGEEYIRQASLWNAEIVRFAVHPVHWNKLGKENYINELKNGVAWAKKYNMYSIIDWHIIGNLKEAKWQHEMYKTDLNETLEFWKIIAQEFKDEPAVAFYELYNEPTVSSGKFGKMNWEELMKIYKQIADTINQYDPSTIKLLGGFDWAYRLTELNDYTPELHNIAFVTHPYPQKSPEPWEENWEKNFGFATKKYPVFATEFGFSYKDQKGAHIPVISDEKYGEAILDYFNKKNISYTIWCFSWQWSPYLLKDSTYAPIEGQGEFFHKKLTGK